ncbi:MAG: cob(I)yrinic acid a,c-diamide adenosyltransferase [Peptococcia bacterium]
MERGYVQIYTGEGKGKTTAAFGLAMRAVGRGLKVLFCQFMKGTATGELNVAAKLAPLLTIHRYGITGKFSWQLNEYELEELKNAIAEGFQEAQSIAQEGKYDVLILDEILVAVKENLLEAEDVCQLILTKSPRTELVLTGRYAAPEILELADLVTEMKEVKHYYAKGVPAREGIEY